MVAVAVFDSSSSASAVVEGCQIGIEMQVVKQKIEENKADGATRSQSEAHKQSGCLIVN